GKTGSGRARIIRQAGTASSTPAKADTPGSSPSSPSSSRTTPNERPPSRPSNQPKVTRSAGPAPSRPCSTTEVGKRVAIRHSLVGDAPTISTSRRSPDVRLSWSIHPPAAPASAASRDCCASKPRSPRSAASPSARPTCWRSSTRRRGCAPRGSTWGHAKVCRYRPEENDMLVVAGFGWHEGIVGQVVSRADESSPQGRAFVTGEPVICHDVEGNNSFVLPAFYREHKIVSTVDVIVKGREGPPFGILEIDSITPQSYDEHDVNFLTGFANVLAEAVATASRAEVLRQTVAQMRVLVAEKDQLLAEKGVLAQELQHRVRNNLQLVNGMLAEQLQLTADEPGKTGLRGILRRITTLSKVYDQLLGVGLSRTLDFSEY